MGSDMTPDEQDVSRLVREFGTRHRAPESLRAGLRAHLALTEALRPAPAVAPQAAPGRGRPGRWGAGGRAVAWRHGLAGFALGVLLMAMAPQMTVRLGLDQPDAAEVVGNHVHALQIGPVAEVLSSDRHTVKPWFQGRLDYAPPVLDLEGDGFPLLGGRIERLRGHTVATLAYARRRHVIDLYVWPASARSVQVRTTHRGYHVLHWSDTAMQYWAVSDLDPRELEQFTRLWRERAAAP